jgi:hypothetical protein
MSIYFNWEVTMEELCSGVCQDELGVCFTQMRLHVPDGAIFLPKSSLVPFVFCATGAYIDVWKLL